MRRSPHRTFAYRSSSPPCGRRASRLIFNSVAIRTRTKSGCVWLREMNASLLGMGGGIVHTGWVTTIPKHEPYLRRKLILQAGDIFLYDHYTQPSHRSLGLARARDVHVLHHYREKGYRRSLAIVAVENRAAFRPFKALGYHSIGMFKCLRLGPWQWTWEERWGEDPLPVSTKTGT